MVDGDGTVRTPRSRGTGLACVPLNVCDSCGWKCTCGWGPAGHPERNGVESRMVRSTEQPPTVLVTGSNGMIGRLLIDAWRASGRYRPVGLARQAGEHTDIVADIANLDALF